MIYSGIGSRQTPKDVLEKMFHIATVLAKRNHTLRSGGAIGADSAFEQGHLKHHDINLQIYIPWRNFVTILKNYHIISKDDPVAQCIAKSIHPAWHKLSQGARLLHTRNVYQVLGINQADKPSDFLLCYTSDGKDNGGTRTAIILARQNHIPVFNLYDYPNDNAYQILKKVQKSLDKPL